MKTRTVIVLGLVAGIVVLLVVFARPIVWPILFPPKARVIGFDADASGAGEGPFTFERYATVLAATVDANGMVNYSALKANSGDLDAFGAMLGALDANVYAAWPEKQQIAFWINAYNALTLKAIISHYPISGSSPLYPKSSIRQILGGHAWDKLEFIVMGEKRTLNEIEHTVLRKQFSEPRIHVALVCAAISCPPLRNEPFVAERLDEQLDDQGRRFAASTKGLRIDRSAKRVYLSAIFKWFGDDFIAVYGAEDKFTGKTAAQRAVLNYISAYVGDDDRTYLETGHYTVKYLDYDWTLNEQKR